MSFYIINYVFNPNCIKHMKSNRYGRIINTSSVGVKYGGGRDTFAYSLSKHVNEFIPSSLRDLSKYNVLYNTVRIGVTNTKIHKNIKNKSIKNKIDPKITHKIWKNMIYAYIDFERRNFNKKK